MRSIDIEWDEKPYIIAYEVHEETHPDYAGMSRQTLKKYFDVEEDAIPSLKIINILSPLGDVPRDEVQLQIKEQEGGDIWFE